MTDPFLYGPGPQTPHEDCSGEEDDMQSDISEASSEAWVVCRSFPWRDDLADINDSTSLASYEPENWDAELETNENPYDEDDVATECEEQISACEYHWGSDDSYEPSLHHAPSIHWSRGDISSAAHIEVGQFEDAEQ
ncbi:hypothetical protein GDO78_021394 [Eleutherodactylus coqui]|uniref:Coordinator of PRMT5 and differentiation stimulator n=1 Tax=Eleutherodactylus coqui TaxID=57060 RepID=A0A8J6E822_ELECQ|nr:hypothetical protein GDO78_021394 [Eleutherodactylus coqui]